MLLHPLQLPLLLALLLSLLLPLYLPWCLRLGTAMGPLTPQLVRPQSDDIHRLRDFGRGAADAGFGPKATTYVGYGLWGV